MGRFLSLIARNSWRNRRRTTLTVLSIATSLCLLGVVMTMYRAFYLSEAPAWQAMRLVTRNRVSLAVPMPLYYREKIRQAPGVREVAASQWFGGTYKDSRDPKNFFARLAIEPDKLFAIRGEIRVPEDEQKAFLSDRTGAIAGRALARTHGWKIGERITLAGDIFPVTLELTLRAIFDAPENDEVLYFHFKYLEESATEGRLSQVGTFNILASSVDEVPKIAKAVDDLFHNSPVQTRTESEQEFSRSFLSFLGNVKAFLLSICAAVTFTVLLVAANTIAMSVRERIREIGILKTLGFTRADILATVIGESVLIAAAGGLLGSLLAAGLCAAVRNGPIGMPVLRQLTLGPAVVSASMLVAALVGVASSVLPAWGAARLPIVEAIRHTG